MYWMIFKTMLKARWLPWALVSAVGIGSGLYLVAYGRGVNHGAASVQALWDAAALEQQQELARLEAQHRRQELALQNEITGVTDALHYQLMQTETELAIALDAARTDAGRLRIDNARCAARLSNAVRAADTAGGNDGAAAERVVPEPNPAVAILQLAAEADRVAARLKSCQQYVNEVTK